MRTNQLIGLVTGEERTMEAAICFSNEDVLEDAESVAVTIAIQLL